MPRWIKLALAGIAALVVLFVGGLAILAHTLDLERYARLATEQIKLATGRDLRIDGKLEVRVFPRLAIVAENVVFGNAPWGSRREMARIKRVEGAIALLPLLRREIDIVRLVAIEPDVLLETDAKGIGNWVFGADKPRPADPGAGVPEIGVSAVAVDRGVLAYRNGITKQTVRLGIRRMRMSEKLITTRTDVDLQATLRDQTFTLKGTTGTVKRLFARDANWPVDIVLTTAGARASFDGVADWGAKLPGLTGTLTAEVGQPDGVARLVGAPIPLPTPLSITAKLTAAPGVQHADPIQITIAKSTAHARVAVRYPTVISGAAEQRAVNSSASPKASTGRPLVSIGLTAREIDLTPLAATNPPSTRAGKVFSDVPFPLDALRALDGDVNIALDRLVLPNRLPLERMTARATLKGGRLDLQPLQASLGGGAINGRAVLDASKTPSLVIDVDGKGISMEKIAIGMDQGGTIAGGSTDIAIRLSGPGESLHRFVGWANGEARLVIGPARVSGIALDAGGDVLTRILDAANPTRRKDPYTDVKCAVVRLPVQDGIATSRRSIAYETSKINVAIAGTINLRTEALDLAIRPSLKEGLGIGVANLAELVRVGGTLREPSIGIDTLESAKAALSVGGAILTGGLSLLGQALLSARTDDPHPCQSALETTQGGNPEQTKEGQGLFGSVRRLFR
jgi:AsmA family protein